MTTNPVTTAQRTEVGLTVAGSGAGSAIGEAADAEISKTIALKRSIASSVLQASRQHEMSASSVLQASSVTIEHTSFITFRRQGCGPRSKVIHQIQYQRHEAYHRG